MAKSMYSFLPTDYVFNVWKLNIANDNYDLVTKLQYQDIINSSIELNSRGADILKLQIKNYDKAKIINDDDINGVYLYERLIYQNPDSGIDGYSEYNLFFFSTKTAYTFEMVDNVLQTTFTIEALDWKGYVEDYRIINHTTIYPEGPQMIDANGDLPYNFNKIQIPTSNGTGTGSGKVIDILKFIYKYNFTEPRPIIKGTSTYGALEPYRKIKALDTLIVVDNPVETTTVRYTTVRDKCSMSELLSDIYDYCGYEKKQPGYHMYRPNLKMMPNGKIAVVVIKSKAFIIDNFEVNDTPIRYDYLLDSSSELSFVISESEQNDTHERSVVYVHGVETVGLTTRELKDTGTYNNADLGQSLADHATGVLHSSRAVSDISLEIEFKNHVFLKDFTVNDRLELRNFEPDFLNVQLHIKQISEIIEDNYVSYAISESEKTIINF